MAITREEAAKLGLVDLYDEVKCLEGLTDQQQIIRKLQDIGAKLLTEYEVKIGTTTIHPLRVEAYYYPFEKPGTFDDISAHPSPKKIDHFGQLYFIEEKYGYPGVDICLSCGNYYLSYLIKNSLIDQTAYKQIDLYDYLKGKNEDDENSYVLLAMEYNHEPVFQTARVGLGNKPFATAQLSSLIQINRKNPAGKCLYTFEKGFGKEAAIKQYMANHPNTKPSDFS